MIKAFTNNVLRAEKRYLPRESAGDRLRLTILATWIGLLLVAITTATFSFFFVDWERRLAHFSSNAVDPITTASLGQQQTAAVRSDAIGLANRKQINDLITVIRRLRQEQAQLIGRIASLENELRSVRAEAAQRQTYGAGETVAKGDRLQPAEPIPPRVVDIAPQETERPVVNPDAFRIRSVRTRRVEPDATVPRNDEPTQTSSTSGGGNAVATTETDGRVIKSISSTGTADEDDASQSEATRSSREDPAETIFSQAGAEIDRTTVGSINPVQARFALDLGINPDDAGARSLWDELSEQKPQIFGPLQAIFQPLEQANGQTRLLGGPYLDAADAIRDCVELRRINAFCQPTNYPR